MKTIKNKTPIVVTIILVIVSIAGLAWAYVFTDMLKSEKQLFAKYIIQNAEEIGQILDIKEFEQISEKLGKNKNEGQSVLTIEGSRNQEIVLTTDSQSDPINNKTYKKMKLALEDGKEAIEAEYMQENDIYALRFTSAVKQFLSIRNENLKKVAESMGMEKELISKIPDKIDFEKYTLEELGLTQKERVKELAKYATLIYNNTSNGEYSKNKEALITVNGKTLTTNLYSLTLTERELNNIELKIFEELKQDETIINMILSIEKLVNQNVDTEKVRQEYLEFMQQQIDILQQEEFSEEVKMTVTVYEQNGKTVRIKIENELETLTIDTITDEETKVDIKYTGIDDYQKTISNTISIIKNQNAKNNLTVEITNVQDEEKQKSIINIETKQSENNIQLNISIDLEDEPIEKVTFTSNINLVEELNYKITLDDKNNYILNDLSAESVQNILEQIGDRVTQQYAEPIFEIVIDFILPSIFDDIFEDIENTFEDTVEDVGNSLENMLQDAENMINNNLNNESKNTL